MTEQEKIEKLKEANRILDRVIELLEDLFERHRVRCTLDRIRKSCRK